MIRGLASIKHSLEFKQFLKNPRDHDSFMEAKESKSMRGLCGFDMIGFTVHLKFTQKNGLLLYPIGSMYGIFTYTWLKFMVNVGKCTIHGFYGYYKIPVVKYKKKTAAASCTSDAKTVSRSSILALISKVEGMVGLGWMSFLIKTQGNKPCGDSTTNRLAVAS